MAGGELAPPANMSLAQATAICQGNRRCYGWTAAMPFFAAGCAGDSATLRSVQFKDAWGARRITKAKEFTSWVLLHREQAAVGSQ